MKKDDFTICKFQEKMSEYHAKAKQFCDDFGVFIYYKYDGWKLYFPDDKEERDTYLIRIERNGKRMEITYGASLIDTRNGVKPNSYDILTCIEKYDPYDFKNFCAEYGYDEDSRKAYGIYENVLEQWKQVEELFGDCLDELREIN